MSDENRFDGVLQLADWCEQHGYQEVIPESLRMLVASVLNWTERACEVEKAVTPLLALAERLVALDDNDDPAALADRRTITLNTIIEEARAALATAGVQSKGRQR